MGFKISPFEAFNRAERQHDKFNRRNPSQQSKLPTLEEQLKMLEDLEEKARQDRLKKMEETKNEKRFSPLYEAKFKSEKSKNKK